ncbi:FecCD family ABC transporter permease [Actinacidiphila epipremni]|uniref:Iron chelate uptake ABC transporter family permease subunit n=1 Tax=Actinacidiphila epipremni TaxID=2053013 RepID=A0ABX0ZS26_9ACTN|nr:iron chelate uptake ABC transporter family permease subunit [Actinacidiphila epipremni]NJP46758.1 iron chelate uptake ABC transporter family permease subunit [Actinacidiphila epipremni]
MSALLADGTRTGRPRRRVVAHLGGGYAVRLDVRTWLVGAVLLAALAVVSVVTLSTGDYHVPPADVVRTLLGGGDPGDSFVVRTLRLPRLLTGLLVGAALGVGGGIFQSVSRNPLGSPDIIGFDTGAASGALVVILALHGSMAEIAAGSVIGGVGTAVLVYLLAMRKGVQGYRLILVGIGIAALLASVNSYLLTRASVTDAQSAAVWLTGSLNGRGWSQVRAVALAVAVLLPLAVPLGRLLRMLELGDDTARALGLAPERIRLSAIVVGVGLTATATACAGPIVFIALAAPQIARRLTKVPGPNVVPAALTGALLLVAADLAAQRVFDPKQLPVGIATGVLGGLYLAWLLGREWRRGRG